MDARLLMECTDRIDCASEPLWASTGNGGMPPKLKGGADGAWGPPRPALSNDCPEGTNTVFLTSRRPRTVPGFLGVAT